MESGNAFGIPMAPSADQEIAQGLAQGDLEIFFRLRSNERQLEPQAVGRTKW
jgi:hypothetical protein